MSSKAPTKSRRVVASKFQGNSATVGLKKKSITPDQIAALRGITSPVVLSSGQGKSDVDAVLDNEEVDLLLFKEEEFVSVAVSS